jgi:hypothetical protein
VSEKPQKRRRAPAVAALLGVALGASCYCVPPEYQTVCAAVAKIAAACVGG